MITSCNFLNVSLWVSPLQNSETFKAGNDQRLLGKQAISGMWHILSFLKDSGFNRDQGLIQVNCWTSNLRNYVQIHILAACIQWLF